MTSRERVPLALQHTKRDRLLVVIVGLLLRASIFPEFALERRVPGCQTEYIFGNIRS